MKNILFVLTIILLYSCGASSEKNNKKASIKKPVPVSNKQAKIDKKVSNIKEVPFDGKVVTNPYIASLAKELKLPYSVQVKLLKIEKKFAQQRVQLVKSGAWDGPKNKTARLDYTKAKNKEHRATLGNDLFLKKVQYDKKQK